MSKGWVALIDQKLVTFLAPNFLIFSCYDSPNVLAVSEYVNPVSKIHRVAFISPTLIEVYVCWHFKYSFMKRSHNIEIHNFWISHV